MSEVEESVAANQLTPTRIYVKNEMVLINEMKILSLAKWRRRSLMNQQVKNEKEQLVW